MDKSGRQYAKSNKPDTGRKKKKKTVQLHIHVESKKADYI